MSFTSYVKNIVYLMVFVFLLSCSKKQALILNNDLNEAQLYNQDISKMSDQTNDKIIPVNKTEQEWKQELSSEEFRILRKQGTEQAFTGKLLDSKEKGVYTCAACNLSLFSSSTKYKSGTGWPSFYQPIKEHHVREKSDRSYGVSRTEIVCARCGGHLGHIFPDGPEPTGKRYCINSIALDFVKDSTTTPK